MREQLSTHKRGPEEVDLHRGGAGFADKNRKMELMDSVQTLDPTKSKIWRCQYDVSHLCLRIGNSITIIIALQKAKGQCFRCKSITNDIEMVHNQNVGLYGDNLPVLKP